MNPKKTISDSISPRQVKIRLVLFIITAVLLVGRLLTYRGDKDNRPDSLRQQGKWKFRHSRLNVVNNFTGQFNHILDRASCKRGEFHDFRRTALTNWLATGMSEHEVMILAGHASFNTTHRFHLAVATDLVDRARVASNQVLCQDLLRTCCAPPILAQNDRHR